MRRKRQMCYSIIRVLRDLVCVVNVVLMRVYSTFVIVIKFVSTFIN